MKLSSSYLYKSADYGKSVFQYFVSAERVDKNSEGFADVIYAVKKQAPSILLKVLLSDKVNLMIDQKGVSTAFKVLYARDPKNNKGKTRVFIDCTGIIKYENGTYVCKKIGTLVSYLTTAMTYVIYNNNPKAITLDYTLTKTGAAAFTDMMLYVLGYLKVPVSYADNKERMSFVISEYYQICVLGLENSQSVYNVAKNVSGIKEKNTCDYLHTLFSFIFNDSECNINTFLKKFAEVFLDQKDDDTSAAKKNRTVLTVDAFAQRWMYVFGPCTIFGLECFVPFSQMITDCYNGSYINQQNTIEKVVGSKNIVAFANELFKVGSENA